MDLTEYRASDQEQLRIRDLMTLVPHKGNSALDVGARDGYISNALTEYFQSITALDLITPEIDHPSITNLQGDITALEFPNNHFDLVLCSEVLEHIPGDNLIRACKELARVSKKYLIIGVPYQQDLRVGRTTCQSCGQKNPPWGHVNRFDEQKLAQLFSGLSIEKLSYVGKQSSVTNFMSTYLMDLAGNPYGNYDQEEPCIHCGQALKPLPPAKFKHKVLRKTAQTIKNIQNRFVTPKSNWIHILFKKH